MSSSSISTIIFDVDDTLYDVATGFTGTRNGPVVWKFMVEELGFPDIETAKQVRDTYFAKYHATAKALQVAQAEGKFPPNCRHFDPKDLSEYWATNLDYTLLPPKSNDFIRDFQTLPLKLVAFSNGPRKYVQRALVQLGLWGTIFQEDTLFAVDDVLPHCKPEPEAFCKIFDRLNIKARECIMVEDSMKNIRQAKQLGMRTVLIYGSKDCENSLSTKPGDAPDHQDPAVDVAMATIEDFRSAVSGLWKTPVEFP